MADLNTTAVVGDTGSQEVAQLRRSYNELCDAMGDLVTALKTAGDIAAVNTAATNAEAAMEANVTKQSQKPGVPLAPANPPELPGTL